MSRRDDAKERIRRQQEEQARRKEAERAARREAQRRASIAGSAAAEARRESSSAPSVEAATFGEMLAATGLLAKTSELTRQLIARRDAEVDRSERLTLKVISCTTCVAPKGCCRLSVGVQLYEAVPVAARLIREGRDTPELRARLEAAAVAMETTARDDYAAPCVFLDAAERCTVYEDRPSECGFHFVVSDPALCSSADPDVCVETPVMAPDLAATPFRVEKQFTVDAGLQRVAQPYRGALPRMVLVCLEAWTRRDYVDYLEATVPSASRRFDLALGAAPRGSPSTRSSPGG